MKNIFFIALALLLCSSAAQPKDLLLEAATGLGSPYSPFSSKWNGAVGQNGLYFREYAFRASYPLHEYLIAHASVGWINERHTSIGDIIPVVSPPYGEYPASPAHVRNVTYFVPSVTVSLKPARFDFGAVIYYNDYADWGFDNYPFNGSHRLKPLMGLELGDENLYIFARSLASFPLYSGGLGEIGVGGRISGVYEQKLSILGGPYTADGLGYRGEFRIYRKTAISAGFSVQGTNRADVYLLSIGFKTII